MKTNTIKGDLIELAKQGAFDAIVHGCNCFCAMGKGIALQIKREFPDAYRIDSITKKGDLNKLGTYTVGFHGDLHIINAYTQYEFWGPGVKSDYHAIQRVFAQINKDYAGRKVGIPRIGAGEARGDWDRIQKIINEVTPDIDITVVEWSGR